VVGDGGVTGGVTAERRRGVLAGLGAYTCWGLVPLLFHALRSVGAFQVLYHRVAWSFLVLAALLVLRPDRAGLALLRARPAVLGRLALAALLIASNWVVYIWAVGRGSATEGALGYYVNPLLVAALGIVVFGERLRPVQLVALGLGALAVVVMTVAYGRVPWIALFLAASFAAYGYLKKTVPVGAALSLAAETCFLLPFSAVALVVLQLRGDAAFTNGSVGRDVLLVTMGAATAVPLLLFGVAAQRVPLTVLGLMQYLSPTIQLVCALWVFGEDLPPERLVGFVIVWVALVLLAWDAVGAWRRRPAPTPVPEPV